MPLFWVGSNSGNPATVSWGDLIGTVTNQADLVTYVAAQIGTGTTLNNSVFVSKNGSDVTGALGKISKPFLTIKAAYDAAVAAGTTYTVFVFPGAYTEAGITLKTDVNIRCEGYGTLDTSSGTALFVDGGVVANCTVDLGKWQFNSASGKNFFYCTAASEIFFFGRAIDTNGTHFNLNSATPPSIHATFDMICQDAGSQMVDIAQPANFVGVFNTVNTVGGKAFWVEAGGNVYITFNYGGSTQEFFKVDGAATTDVFHVVGKELVCYGNYWPIWVSDSENCYVNIQSVTGASDCLSVASGSTCKAWFNYSRILNNYGLTVDGTVHAETGATVYFTGNIERGAGMVGNDLKCFNSSSKIYLNGATFDITRVDWGGGTDNIKQWNGTIYDVITRITNNSAGSGNAITSAVLYGGVVDFAGFTGCTLNGPIMKGHTYTFTANSQTISVPSIKKKEYWVSCTWTAGVLDAATVQKDTTGYTMGVAAAGGTADINVTCAENMFNEGRFEMSFYPAPTDGQSTIIQLPITPGAIYLQAQYGGSADTQGWLQGPNFSRSLIKIEFLD